MLKFGLGTVEGETSGLVTAGGGTGGLLATGRGTASLEEQYLVQELKLMEPWCISLLVSH